MSVDYDPSGFSGPRLGLGHDSGWSQLSGNKGMVSMGLDFDQIAGDAVDEMFGARGGRGRGVAARAAWRATHPRASVRRDYLRAGWGSPGWQASEGGGWMDPTFEEPIEDDLSPEEESFLEEDDYDPSDWHGRRGGQVVAAEEEYGRRSGRPARRVARRVRRRQKARRERRRERRQAGWGSPFAPQIDASRTPLGSEEGAYEPEPYPELPEPFYPEDDFDMEMFGNISAPVQQHPSTFRSALETGIGLGIGFMGVALGVQLIAQAVSGRR